MSSATTPPSVDTYTLTVPVSSPGCFLTLGSHGNPRLGVMPAGRLIAGWSVSTRPTDANGAIYVCADASGPLTATEAAAQITAGRAVRLDPGEVIQTPACVPGPFNLNLAVTSVGAATSIRLVIHLIAESPR